jgi:hypothetical protein
MIAGADTRYGYRAWDRRPGDGVDPSPVALNPAETILAVENQVPFPVPAGVPMRFIGMVRTPPTIEDVLDVGAQPLMQDTPTRQDSGMQGTLRPAMSAY